MIRLTNGSGIWSSRMDSETIAELYKRLSEYENTGMTPEEFRVFRAQYVTALKDQAKEWKQKIKDLDAALSVACRWLEQSGACAHYAGYICDKDFTSPGTCGTCLKKHMKKLAREERKNGT